MTALLLLVVNSCSKIGHGAFPRSVLTESQVVKAISLAAERNKVKLSQAAIHASKRIAWKESRFNPKGQNSKSSAYGLFGFLNATWKNLGTVKTSCPVCQSKAFLRYVKTRYSTPERALAFHRRNGWY